MKVEVLFREFRAECGRAGVANGLVLLVAVVHVTAESFPDSIIDYPQSPMCPKIPVLQA